MGKMLLDETFQYTPEQKVKIKRLRKLIKKCAELEVGTENVLLTKFLYHANWNVQEAYECIQRYYDFKLRNPKWVAAGPVRHFRELLFSTRSRFIMPQPDKHGRLIVVIRAVDAFDKYPNYMYDVIQMDDLIFESLLLLPRVQKHGVTIINDLNNGTTRNILRVLTPANARLISEKTNISPCSRVVHLIQKGFLMNLTSSLIMPFLSKEIRKQIFTHDGKNFSKLREMVGYECLPAGLGGPEHNVLDTNLLFDHMLRHEDYLLQMQSYRKRIC